MKLNFYLKESSSSRESSIILYIRSGRSGPGVKNTIKINTGLRIKSSLWNYNSKRVKRGAVNEETINSALAGILSRAEKVWADLSSTAADIPFSFLESEMRKALQVKVINDNKQNDFFEAFESFIVTKATESQPATIQKFRTIINHLKKFAAARHYSITFENLNFSLYDKFLLYLIQDAGMTNNTPYKALRVLKTFLHWCETRGYPVTGDFKKLRIKNFDTEIVYLTEEELMHLYSLPLEAGSALERVRDVFCFGCLTGQRFSDISKLQHSDILDNTWHLRTTKTKDIIQIPLNEYAVEVLEKYSDDEKPLPVISGQKTNEHLKKLCELAGMSNLINIHTYRGGETTSESVPKFSLIGTHTARRTFVTLSLEKGMRPEVVMEITGHKDYKVFKRYIKITSKAKQVEMKRIWTKPKPQMQLVS